MAASMKSGSDWVDTDLKIIRLELNDLAEYAENWYSVPYGEQIAVEVNWDHNLGESLRVLQNAAMTSEQSKLYSKLLEDLWNARAQFAAIGVTEEQLARALQIAPVHA